MTPAGEPLVRQPQQARPSVIRRGDAGAAGMVFRQARTGHKVHGSFGHIDRHGFQGHSSASQSSCAHFEAKEALPSARQATIKASISAKFCKTGVNST